ncbi:hypothetical protein FA13DRAFT_1814784 [Coprinellus micaceus]|uniref:Uncharacterized protein n=1 Tax=Coprinellus micaceus TaxID=71717 RepID=A0A4Y7T842_COPMI|nr:hypothetical protein FA13DRAFT_1814784 [Coprinellus micaceus]
MPTTSRPTAISRVGSPSSRPFALPRIKIAASTLFSRSDSRLTELRNHNLQRGPCRLPERVLREIFDLCAATSIGRPNAELSLPSPRTHGRQSSGGDQVWSWVMISYVCRTWRKVALEYPELWRYVDFSHPRWTAVTLSRAKMQSLCVHAVVGRHNLQQLHRTLQFAHRIASVHLDSSLHHIHGLLDTLVHPNPSVGSITVRVNTAGHGVEGQVYPLPAYPLVGPDLPSMRYLELHSAPFYLISNRYVSLQELHVHDLTPCQRPTVDQFMCALSKFKDLEHLSLDNAFPLLTNSVPFPHLHSPPISPTASTHQSPSSSPPTGPFPSLPPLPPFPKSPSTFKNRRISLPHLSTLRLTGTITEITTVLNCVNLPPDTSLTCVITNLSDWHQSMPKLAQALAAHSGASANAGFPVQTLVLSGMEVDAYPTARQGMIYGGAHTAAPLISKSIRIRGFGSGKPGRKPSLRGRGPVRDGSPTGRASETRTPSLDLIIGPDSDPDFSTDEVIVGALCSAWKALTLGNVQTLVLHDLDFVTQKTWSQLMKTLPSLRVLDVTGHPPSGFIWALLLNAVACIQREERERERRDKREKKLAQRFRLRADDDWCTSPDMSPTSPLTPNPSLSRSLFVPRLADIYLHGVDCSMGGYMVASTAPVNSHANLDDSRFLDVLLACLQMRSQASAICGGSNSPWSSGSSAPPSATFTLSPGSESLSDPGSPVQFDLLPTQSKLRSVSLANCRSVAKGTALLLNEFVSHCVWDQRGMMKPEEDTGLARYRKVGQGPGAPRHYYRLRTLLDELDM